MISYLSRRSLVSVAALTGLLLSAIGYAPVAHADNQNPPLQPWKTGEEPFPGCDTRAFMMQVLASRQRGQLGYLDLSGSAEVTVVPIGPQTEGYEYNAMAYNIKDDFLYAVKNGDDPGDLLRIGKDGVPRYVGTLDLPPGFRAVAADFDDDGYYYISSGSRIQKFQITDTGPVAMWDEPFDTGQAVLDWGFYNGALWAVKSFYNAVDTTYAVVKLDVKGQNGQPTGQVVSGPDQVLADRFEVTSIFPSIGGIYAYDTFGGALYRIDIPTDNPADATLQHLAEAAILSGSDGAKCHNSPINLPAEISVEKTAPTSSFVPGSPAEFTIRVENLGPRGAAGILVEDPLPAGAINATWTCTANGNSQCHEGSGTGPISVLVDLTEVGSYVTFEVTMETDPNASGELQNTATITVPPDFLDEVNNNTSSYTLIEPRLQLEKTGAWIDENDNGAPDVGEPVEFTFIVRNPSDVDLSNITIVDPMISSFTPASVASLPVGGQEQLVGRYLLTLEDIVAEKIVNTAFATGSTGTSTMRSDDAMAEVPLPPPAPKLHTVKTATFLDDIEANELPDVGERIEFRVKVLNQGNVTMIVSPPIDEGPLFNGVKMAGTMTPFTPEQHEVPRNEEREFVAYYHLTREDIDRAAGVENAIENTVITPAQTPQDIARGTPPTRYELPEPAIATLPGYGLQKNAQVGQVMRGQQVPYTIKITPQQVSGPVTVVDRPPPGFVFLPGSARMDGRTLEPQIEGTALKFDLDVQDEVRIDYVLVATGAVSLGTYVNTAQVFQAGQLDKPISAIAKDDVEVVPDPIFDCGEVIGTVFDDRNRNGYQDKGEPGMPAARVASVEGVLITTDRHGRFNVACADLPNGRVGSTYIMKLDPRSLPTGYRILSENPRTIRLTAGKVSALNFATSITRVVRLDVNNSAFLPGEVTLLPEWERELSKLVQMLETEPSVLRLSYIDNEAERSLAGKRLNQLRSKIASNWSQRRHRYRLEIEARLVIAPGLASSSTASGESR